MSASICHRCGTRVVYREFSAGLTLITVSQLLETAYWCENCTGLLCASCGGMRPPKNETSVMLGTTAFCAVCKKAMEPAVEDQMMHAMSPQLRKPAAKKGILSRLFAAKAQPAGSLAYFFAVTQHTKPASTEASNAYLHDLFTMCMGTAVSISATAKFAAIFETDPVDRSQIVKWASDVFTVGFEQLSTHYLLTFKRFEHDSGNGHVLIAAHPPES